MTETRSKHGGARVRFPPPVVFLALVAVGVAIERWLWPISIPVVSWLRIASGSVVAVFGLLLAVAANRWFKRTGQDPAPWKPSPELIVQGVYRHTRNPMYVGMTLLQLGLGIAIDDPWVAGLAPLGLALVHFIAVRPEERYLEEKFGESYLRYASKVRRYL
jgi:protein-S-isoprenylcysteine O-methyltransferase Ste14